MQFHTRYFATFCFLIFACVRPCDAQQRLEFRGTTMGSIGYTVLVVSDDSEPKQLKAIKTNIDISLERVNKLMSTYLEDSDISKFNRSESEDWQSVDKETAAVVARALEICELTDGAFDPTVGPLVNAWNFGPNKKEVAKIPDDDRIKKLKSLIGFSSIEVRADPAAIRKRNPKVQLDLSAIAKGYAVDRVGRTLEDMGYEDYMVEVGGEVATRGERAQGGPWNVAVERPDSKAHLDNASRAHRITQLSGKAVATSGNYRNYIDIDGKRFSHTIDPKTGRPVEHNLSIASVVADDCMTADAIATAVMVMGTEKGSQLCEANGFPLLTVSRSDSDDGLPYITAMSKDFSIANIEEAGTSESGDQTETESGSSSAGEILPVFLATFVVFCLMILGMAVGAIFNNKPVTGSCGGIANMTNEDGEQVCGICSKPTVDCEENEAPTSSA